MGNGKWEMGNTRWKMKDERENSRYTREKTKDGRWKRQDKSKSCWFNGYNCVLSHRRSGFDSQTGRNSIFEEIGNIMYERNEFLELLNEIYSRIQSN
jgi:hypothetical protein